MTDFNQFANGRFCRTEPREWRYLPFAGGRLWWHGWPRFIGWCVFWGALFGLSLWSIAQQVPK